MATSEGDRFGLFFVEQFQRYLSTKDAAPGCSAKTSDSRGWHAGSTIPIGTKRNRNIIRYVLAFCEAPQFLRLGISSSVTDQTRKSVASSARFLVGLSYAEDGWFRVNLVAYHFSDERAGGQSRIH